ncbi:hypothetical protein HD554DRAFT_1111789 [Boletus coccyginus]|nr:hypothetical protein HD554DRAFT_1111789 [Boletus coccyginus]
MWSVRSSLTCCQSLYGSAPAGGYINTRHAAETDKITSPAPYVSERDPKTRTKVLDTFHRLAKLCCEIVQDTCFLDREEDKLKALTSLSSELSRAVPDAAVAVTPALATVITGHTRTRERLENHAEELETLWKTLFSTLEGDISRVIESRLEQAMTLLHKERDSALRMITRSQNLVSDRLHDGTTGPLQRTDSWKENVTARTTTLSERGRSSVNGGPAINVSPEGTRHHGGSTSLSLVPTQEGDLGTSLRIVLEDMKMQMDRQTRAIELLAQENLQLRSTTERIPPQLVPPDSTSSSPRKPSIL